MNQYAITWGAQKLREALAAKYDAVYGLAIDAEREITVTCGATEGMIATLLALVNPGDEVIVFEPFYENYGPDTILSDAKPVFVPLEPGRPLDLDRLAAAFGPRTRAIVVNTPSNPAGRVLDTRELEAIRDLCVRHDCLAITDEIYEHMVYDGMHRPLATLDGMRDRTVTISGASKTFGVTGWRIGWAIAPERFTDAIRKVHDFLTVGAPAPLQEAVAVAVRSFDRRFYEELAAAYRARREILHPALGVGRLPLLGAGGGLLHPRGLLGAERPAGHRLRGLAVARSGRDPGAGIELLSRPVRVVARWCGSSSARPTTSCMRRHSGSPRSGRRMPGRRSGAMHFGRRFAADFRADGGGG